MNSARKDSGEEPWGQLDSDDEQTQSVTFTVSLPVTVHETPDDEKAVAIDEVAIDHTYLDSADLGTRSISLVAKDVLTVPDVPADTGPVIPALPKSDQYSKKERARGDHISAMPEPASALTAERLIDAKASRGARAPEGFFQSLLYKSTFGLVNVGDSKAARARKAVDARIEKHFEGGTRFVPVLTRKGGVGKTTIASLLGMALADVREDRVIAIDANPDRGTLAERVSTATNYTVRDVVLRAPEITTFNEFQTLVARDETRLDILASDTDPSVSQAFDENDYNVVADMAERFYSIAITDCGTGIVHSVMRATLQRADSIVIVSGGSVDEARLASETLTWLESNGYGDLVSNAVVAINTATQGTNLVNLDEIEAHFQSRVRETVLVPYDPSLATGSTIRFADLRPLTKTAARELAATVADGLPVRREGD